MALSYKDLQPWVDMLIDALENRGSSSSGIPDIKVYPYAQKYRDMLQMIRDKKISKYHLNQFLEQNYNEVMLLTTQKYRVKNILDAIKFFFIKNL